MVGSPKRKRGLIIFGLPIDATLSAQITWISLIKEQRKQTTQLKFN